ncbi:hypothetical protein PBAL39_18764 [Pedobacter sp. BAL39]|uniref:YdeI/OmpD-associated family protein n=1 Tax=Pedobacter sp. BAL39 TaxID=391596 RepID=UPI0001559815|nr:YdeI/OmpD-associated family protein [Pedobacter sp. BAL39]EDM36945.1 hypothetical protein PBAL39_18764 [Pedobacter sp. BAL39]
MEKQQLPIIQGSFQIAKMPGKGGWSFVTFDAIDKQFREKFGVVNVWGFIDDFRLDSYGLMPMANGGLFLPIKAAIRKEIGKQEGDWVSIRLYPKTISSAGDDDLLLCLQDEPEIHELFKMYAEAEQQAFTNWVNAANGDEQRAERIATTMDMILRGKKRAD